MAGHIGIANAASDFLRLVAGGQILERQTLKEANETRILQYQWRRGVSPFCLALLRSPHIPNVCLDRARFWVVEWARESAMETKHS